MTNKKESTLGAGQLVGGASKVRERVEGDYYATPPEDTQKFIDTHELKGTRILEPSCGEGHISEVIKGKYPEREIISRDIYDRGYKDFDRVEDFLESDPNEKFDTIITNPPFKYFQEFIEKGLSKLNDGGELILLGRLQVLEGRKRYELFKDYPPKYVYVSVGRIHTMRNGKRYDENGKKWSSTLAMAWFIWEKGYTGEPIVRWVE